MLYNYDIIRKTGTGLWIIQGPSESGADTSRIDPYISLFGYQDGTDHFIRDTLLEGLRFKPHTDSMESASRELMQLLDK